MTSTPYCTASDVRTLTGVTEAMVTDEDVEALIALTDQQVDDDLGAQSSPVNTRIKNLSALLTAIKVYTRPDLRGGFSVGDVTISNQQIEESLTRWTREVERIYGFYEEPAFKVA